jgi:hypothetical protein
MNILDFEKTEIYRTRLIQGAKLSEDEAFCVLTCLLALEDKEELEALEWQEMLREHCQYEDIRGGLYYAIRNFIDECQFIVKDDFKDLLIFIKLSDTGKTLLDQIRLEALIDDAQISETISLNF